MFLALPVTERKKVVKGMKGNSFKEIWNKRIGVENFDINPILYTVDKTTVLEEYGFSIPKVSVCDVKQIIEEIIEERKNEAN